MEESIAGKVVFKNINDVIPHIGACGRFQQLLTAIFSVMIVPATYQILIMYFGALDPTWKCAENSTLCTAMIGNKTIPGGNEDRCKMQRSDWVFTEQRSFSIRTEFDIYCDKEWLVHLTTSLFFVAWGVGAVFLGWVADSFGRKIVLFPSVMIVILFGFISAFSPNITVLIICRVVIGFFTPGTGVQMVVLLSEFVSTKYRPAVVTIVWFFFSVALCLLGLKAYFIREWKLLLIVTSAPYIFIIAFYKFVPESIRWLHIHSKMDQLMNVFHRIGFWNKKPISADFTMLPFESKKDTKSTPLDLFKTRKMAVHTLIQGYAWLVNGMVYYGLSLAADDLGGSLYTNYILLSAVEFPANLLTIYLCDRVGRKKTTVGAMGLGSLACIAVAFIPTTGSVKIGRILLGILGKSCITISFNAIYTWSLEIYTTDIRAQGMGFLQITSRIGAASSPWVAKGLKALHHVTPFVVMGILSIVAAVLAMFLPETKGVPTRDSSDEEDETGELLEEHGFIASEREAMVA